jgi:hypothetical protein
MAAKGRERLDRELHNAHVVGRFAVDFGLGRVRRQLHDLLGGRPASGDAPTTAPSTGRRSSDDADTPSARAAPGAHAATSVDAGTVPGPAPERDEAVDRAIPDYDSLSASQVVRRLDGLGPDELVAVERHELAGRGRRTIVNRAQQLLASATGGTSGNTPDA